MAQLTYNTMRFETDNFSFSAKRGMLIAKNPINENHDFTHIDKFIIDGENLDDNSVRFFFRVDKRESLGTTHFSQDKVNYLRFNGAGTKVTEHTFCYYQELADYSFDDLFSVAANLSALQYTNDLYDEGKTHACSTAWTGGDIYPIILLQGFGDDLPKIKFGMQFSRRTPPLEKVSHWQEFFDKPTKILDITHDSTVTGAASIDFKYGYIPQGGASFTALNLSKDDVIGKTVDALAFKYTRAVTEIDGADSACAGRYTVTHTEDVDSIVFGDTADLYTITKNYFLPLKYCAVIVKHEELNGAGLKAFAKFDPGAYTVTKRNIGTGTGSKQTITLPTAKYFKPSSLRVFVDNVETTKFDFDVNNNSVTLTATAGAAITATYNYNYPAETWIELTADATQRDISDGLRVTRYHCSDVKKYGDNVMVSAVRLQFIRGTNGNVPRVHGFTAGWAV